MIFLVEKLRKYKWNITGAINTDKYKAKVLEFCRIPLKLEST